MEVVVIQQRRNLPSLPWEGCTSAAPLGCLAWEGSREGPSTAWPSNEMVLLFLPTQDPRAVALEMQQIEPVLRVEVVALVDTQNSLGFLATSAAATAVIARLRRRRVFMVELPGSFWFKGPKTMAFIAWLLVERESCTMTLGMTGQLIVKISCIGSFNWSL